MVPTWNCQVDNDKLCKHWVTILNGIGYLRGIGYW